MVSLDVREYAEKIRSAREAEQNNHSSDSDQLLMKAATIARYRAPDATTVFPLEYAFHLLGGVNGKVILEYGCGDGLNTVVLATRGAKVIALDISAELLTLAKKRLEANDCRGVDLVLGSAHSLPLPDESVDIIFGMAILHHLDLDLAVSEVKRVLKKGGRAIFEEPIRNSKLLDRLRGLFPKRADVSPCERPLTDEEIGNFTAPYTGRARTFQLLLSSVASVLPYGSRRAIKASAHVDSHLLRRFPSLDYYASIRVFEMVKD
jgi:SAM-dependent methyltransferase